MSTTVRTRIIRIGNSQGVRIPKLLLEQTNLDGGVELELQDKQIVIRPARSARHDWEEAYRAMAERGHDGLLDADVLSSSVWDEEEWEW
jgi:antitoxin MazE